MLKSLKNTSNQLKPILVIGFFIKRNKNMGKQFGDAAWRITTEDVNLIFKELADKVGSKFCAFELSLMLEEKKNHGDIDILVLLHPDQDVNPIIESLKPLAKNRNGYCHSFLYQSDLGKPVHVDFLVSRDPNLHRVKKQYYSFNELSATVGVLAKAMNFKYGSEGFFKRYEDKRGNWHDIVIAIDLNVGLQCLGLDPKPLWLKTYEDIVSYVSSSLLFDSNMFNFVFDHDIKRERQNQIWRSLTSLGKKAAINDEDYFFKRLFPEQYKEVENRKNEIEEKVYIMSKYNGNWLMEKFGMKPGTEIGKMLKLISDNFGDKLGDLDEEFIESFVREKLNDN